MLVFYACGWTCLWDDDNGLDDVRMTERDRGRVSTLLPLDDAVSVAAKEGGILVDGDSTMTPLQFLANYGGVSAFGEPFSLVFFPFREILSQIIQICSFFISGGGLQSEASRWPKAIVPYTLETTSKLIKSMA